MLFWDAAALKDCDAFCQDKLQALAHAVLVHVLDLVVVVAAGKLIQSKCRWGSAGNWSFIPALHKLSDMYTAACVQGTCF